MRALPWRARGDGPSDDESRHRRRAALLILAPTYALLAWSHTTGRALL